jgi:tRNA (cmo5U34)-methyltransferase
MANGPHGYQFHLDPSTYLETIRAEVPAYDELQGAVAEATAGIQAERVLELGVGTGQTSRRGARPPPALAKR